MYSNPEQRLRTVKLNYSASSSIAQVVFSLFLVLCFLSFFRKIRRDKG